MSLFYAPPPVYIGGAQPYQAEQLIPTSGPVADAPPLVGSRVPHSVLVAWEPPPPQLQARQLAIIAAPVNAPLIGSVIPQAVLTAWLPPPPVWLGAAQPWQAQQITPPSGPAPQNPPITGSVVPSAVAQWWQLPPPPIVVQALLPPGVFPAQYLPPGAPGWLIPVIASWQPPPPPPQIAAIAIPPNGTVAQNPPIVGAQAPLAVAQWWIDPPPQPTLTQLATPPSGAADTDVIGRRIVRRGRTRLYNWEAEAPSPYLPPPAVDTLEVVWDETEAAIPSDTVEEFTRRLDAIEQAFAEKLRKAQFEKSEAQRQRRIKRLAEAARAEAESALRAATQEAEAADRRRLKLIAEAAERERAEIEDEEDAIRKIILKIAMMS